MHRLLAALVAGVVLLALPPSDSRANALNRDRDPVVISGADLPWLLGAPPHRIVAFRYNGSWLRIPVQVDERAVVDFATIYGDASPSGFTVLTYTDTSTFTGADPDPAFDADDELVFMARDAGDLWAAPPEPPGTVSGSGVQLTVQNPINAAAGYVSLFVSDGSLPPTPSPVLVTNGFFLLPDGAP